ncbi:MAG: phytase, partial [Pedobacter sp.]
MNRLIHIFLLSASVSLAACNNKLISKHKGADVLSPAIVTEKVRHDSDDPAIWINPADATKSLIIGTDKDKDGGLYAFDLKGKVVKRVNNIQRPNNVDIAYGFNLNGKKVDIAITTERETNKLRIFTLPDLTAVDNGGLEVFAGEQERGPMGIALYTRPSDHAIFAVVGRKSGPTEGYLWQYQLADVGNGIITGKVVRKFGKYSGKKEIEAIAVDNDMGFIYYSDEQTGVRKYVA